MDEEENPLDIGEFSGYVVVKEEVGEINVEEEEKEDEKKKTVKKEKKEKNDDDLAILHLKWGATEINRAYNTVSKPNRYQWKEVVHTQVPPFRYSKYDLIIPKKLVLTMKAFMFGNPERVYEFYAGYGGSMKEMEKKNPHRYVTLKVRPEVLAKEEGLWKKKVTKKEKQ